MDLGPESFSWFGLFCLFLWGGLVGWYSVNKSLPK